MKFKQIYKIFICLICITSLFSGVSKQTASAETEFSQGGNEFGLNSKNIEHSLLNSEENEIVFSEQAMDIYSDVMTDVSLLSSEAGIIPQNDIYIFYDKPIEEISNIGEGAVINKDFVYSGTTSLKVKGGLWTGSSEANITFTQAYDISQWSNNASLSVWLYHPSSSDESANDMFEINLYDESGSRRGYFITANKRDEWAKYSVPLNSQNMGFDSFDWSKLKSLKIASRPGTWNASWYWYADEIKIDLGLGDSLPKIVRIENGGEELENFVDSSKPLTFTFSTDIEESSIENISVTVKDNSVPFEKEYSNRRLTINFKEKLFPYFKYKIDFSKIMNTIGFPLQDSDKEYVIHGVADFGCSDILMGIDKATIDVAKFFNTNKKPFLVSVKYNSNGEMTNIKADVFDGTYNDTLSVDIPQVADSEFGAIMAFEDVSSMKIIAEPIFIDIAPENSSLEPFNISGKVENGYKNIYVSAIVLKPGVTFDTLVLNENISDYILNVAVVKTDETGAYDWKFIYTGQESFIGEKNTYFWVKVATPDTESSELIPYFKEETLNEYIKNLKDLIIDETKTKDDFILEFNRCTEVFSLDMKYYDLLTDKDEAAEILYNIGFNDKNAMVEKFVVASAVAALNQNIDTDLTEIMLDIKGNDKTIEKFSNLSETGKENVKNALTSKNFEDDKEAYDTYFESVVVNTITNYKSDGYLQVKDALIFSKINLDEYNNAINKDYIERKLVTSGVTTLKELETKISSLAETKISGGSSGSKGSSSSKKTSGSVNIPVYSTERDGYVLEGKSTFKNEPSELFADLENVKWAKEAISYLFEKGIINGVGNGNFAPQNPVSREEFVAMMVRAFELKAQKQESFVDVENTHWAYEAICAAKEHGLVLGDEEGNFGIGEYISRQDIAVIACRVGGISYNGTENSFDDENEISNYARDAVMALKESKIMSGMGDNTFAPLSITTRAQAAQVIYNLILRG